MKDYIEGTFNIFKPLMDKYLSESSYNEEKYCELIDNIKPKDLALFLRHTFCTRESTLNFLALHIAKESEDYDT